MNYAICFRRLRANTKVKYVENYYLSIVNSMSWEYKERFSKFNGHLFSSCSFIPLIFRMGYAVTNGTNTGYDNDCWSSVRSVGRSEDYLFLPNAETNQSPPVRATRFCAQSMLSTIVTSSPPGPFMINFNSDQVYEGPTKEEIGFRLQYEIL